MKIEMVLSKIGKDGDVPFEAACAVLRQRVRRDFHRRRFAASIGDLSQQLLEIERFGRGADGRQNPFADLVAHRPN